MIEPQLRQSANSRRPPRSTLARGDLRVQILCEDEPANKLPAIWAARFNLTSRTRANQLTAIIPCKNEEHNIRACIESVRHLADEIIVADSGSTDRTLQVVREMGGCRIIQREYVNSANFKNWAIAQAAHPWVLIVDADERLTEQLSEEIHEVLSATPQFVGYRMRFQTLFLGRWLKHSGINTTRATRLFRRECRYRPLSVHSDIDLPREKLGRLKGKFLHRTCHSLTQYITKQNRYATWKARDMYAAGRRTGYLGLLLRPPIRFLQLYIQRAGFLDGAAGLTMCMIAAFYTLMKYAKLFEMTKVAAAERHVPDGVSSEMGVSDASAWAMRLSVPRLEETALRT